MRKITTIEFVGRSIELDILSEQYGELRQELYIPEDLQEYYALAEYYDRVRQAKMGGLDWLIEQWNAILMEGPGGPDDYEPDENKPGRNAWERPETSREKVKIEEPEINFLSQFPPQAHASLLFNTLYSTNSKMMRYLGPGMAGVLKHREKNGASSIGNFVEEVRFVTSGRRPNIIDPVPFGGKYRRVPLLGAKTLRPVNPNGPTPNPNWSAYTGSYDGAGRGKARDPKEIIQKARAGGSGANAPASSGRSKFSGVGPSNGVFVPYAHVISKLETPIGQERMVKGRKTTKKGEVQVSLRPPDPNDPESYLPWDQKTMIPQGKLPFAPQGFRAQATDTSQNSDHVRTDWMRGQEQNPEMFNRRRQDVLARKYPIPANQDYDAKGNPLQGVPVQKQPIRLPAHNMVRPRGWVQSPTDVKGQVLQRTPYRNYNDEEERWNDLEVRAGSYDKAAAKADLEGRTQAAQTFRNQAKALRAGSKSVPQRMPTNSGGNAKVWDTSSKQLSGPGTADPDNPRSYEKTTKGEPTPITMAVHRKELKHLYTLRAVPDSVIQVSPELYEEWQEYAQRAAGGQIGEVQWKNATEHPGDKVFVDNFNEYQFTIDPKDRSFRATKLPQGKEGAEVEVGKSPWYWAKLDNDHRVLFFYKPDTEVYDIPIYSPGVVDTRRGNNPSSMGAFDTQQGGFEARPPRDKEGLERFEFGDNPKEDKGLVGNSMSDERLKWEASGWTVPMKWASKHGVLMGIKELDSRINKGGGRDGDIAALKANRDKIQDAAYKYMTYNARNGKAFDTAGGDGVHVNQMYNKRIFKTLFAAIQQMDMWIKKNPQALESMGYPVGGGKTPSISSMSMDQMNDFLTKLADYEFENWFNKMYASKMQPDQVNQFFDDNEKALNQEFQQTRGQHGLFQTKIHKSHLKNDLHNSQAKISRPDLPAERGGGKAIPDEGMNNHHVLNVTAATLFDLMKEARDYYWKFAAKDMVSKIWQARMKHGDEGRSRSGYDNQEMGSDSSPLHNAGYDDGRNDSDDISDEDLIRRETGQSMGALAKRTSQRAAAEADSGHGVRHQTNLMADFLDEKKKLVQKAKTDLTRASGMAEAAPGNINAVAEKVAAEMNYDELVIMQAAQDRLMTQSKQWIADGMSPGQAEQKMLSMIHDAYADELARRYNARNLKADVLGGSGSNSSAADAAPSPQEIMKTIQSKFDVDNPMYQKIGEEIAKGSMKGLQALERARSSGDIGDEELEDSVAYHAIQYLLQNAHSLDNRSKSHIRRFLTTLSSSGVLWDFQNAAHQIVGDAA